MAEHSCGSSKGPRDFHPVVRAVDFENEGRELAGEPSLPQHIRSSPDEQERSSGGAKPRHYLRVGKQGGEPYGWESTLAHEGGCNAPERLTDNEH
ncbi:hypothetical protein ACLQ2N_22005 [Streptomyces sp. DT224]|uniref:hypothetical protein n=1 Tax=Streptomyces sp. DT224 TaxID=3393426 RepID=UPI003CE930DC